jgi:hypothetical protein
LFKTELQSRSELVGVNGGRVGSGRTDGEFWEYGGWFLKSRSSRRFQDRGEATVAFERLRDLKRRLDDLVPAHSVLALLRTDDGQYQIWTIAPRIETVREWLDRSAATEDRVELTRGLCAFARCLGVGVAVALDAGLSLDLNPGNFAIQGARVRYIDDDIAVRDDAVGVEDAFLARFAEYPDTSDDTWGAYVERFAVEVAAAGPVARVVSLGIPERVAVAAQLWRGTDRWATATAERIREEHGRRA